MMPTAPLLGPLLQAFFAEHLLTHKEASPQTVSAYRDGFRLLLVFLRETTGTEPAALRLTDLDAPQILAFLDHLETRRRNGARSRNARLAALRSFFRFVTMREPGSLAVASRVLAIPVKRCTRPLVGYLTRPEVEALLDSPDRVTWGGRRDHALLLTLYNTGARVSEVARLQRAQVHLGSSACIHLQGKGRKQRSVPLWPKTAQVLRAWFRQLGDGQRLAFPNARGQPLTRDGVAYVLERAVPAAREHCPSLLRKRVSPHVLRHTTAMHLLQAGVDLSVIALWLGHETIETTHGYLEADLATKERALAKLVPTSTTVPRFRPDDALLGFLASL
jgi:site-specific recombinase XerD